MTARYRLRVFVIFAFRSIEQMRQDEIDEKRKVYGRQKVQYMHNIKL